MQCSNNSFAELAVYCKSCLVAVDKVTAASKGGKDIPSDGNSPCNNHCIASLCGIADQQMR
jgi:hypothetical protein